MVRTTAMVKMVSTGSCSYWFCEHVGHVAFHQIEQSILNLHYTHQKSLFPATILLERAFVEFFESTKITVRLV